MLRFPCAKPDVGESPPVDKPMPDNVVYLDDYRPQVVGEVMCGWCCHRWISVYPARALLKDLRCPACNETGAVFHTGQRLEGRSTGGNNSPA